MRAQDPMKDFLDENRNDFDDMELPAGLWDGIESALPKKEVKMVPLRKVLQIAAVALVAITVGLAVLLPQKDGAVMVAANALEKVIEPDAFDQYPELAEAAFYYKVRITEAEDELNAYSIDESDFETLRLLEKELEDLKTDLGEQVDNERLVEAMMQIYQYKLSMLEQMLKQVKSIDNEEIDNDEVVVVSM